MEFSIFLYLLNGVTDTSGLVYPIIVVCHSQDRLEHFSPMFTGKITQGHLSDVSTILESHYLGMSPELLQQSISRFGFSVCA